MTLDVGCGSHNPKGDVNVDCFKGKFNWQEGYEQQGLDCRLIKNFVLADACHLPFQNDSFDLVLSSHVIEHVSYPELMLHELTRVSKGRVIVRCPHRRGSGAKRPFHLNYLDEKWFTNQQSEVKVSISCYDYPFTNRLAIPERFKSTLLWRFIRHCEWLTQKIYPIPLELEAEINK